MERSLKTRYSFFYQWMKKYSHIWVLSYYIVFLIWYFGLQAIQNRPVIDIYTKFDAMIPFISWFIYPYIYWYLYVGGTICYFFFKNKKQFYQCVAFLFGGMTICLIIYTVFPNGYNHRPDIIDGQTLSMCLTRLIYSLDECQNVLPSIHVFNSLACMFALLKCQDRQWVKYMAIGSTIIISLSTLFVKQHSILDVLSALLLSFVMYIVIYKKDLLSRWIKDK